MTRDFQTRARHRVQPAWASVALAVGLLALVYSAYSAVAARRDGGRAARRVSDLRQELQVVKERTAARRSERGGIDETLVAQAYLGASAAPPVLLAALEKALPADVRLTSLVLLYGRQLEVEMRVTARRPDAYDEFLARLSAAEFHDVVPAIESREDGVQATVHARFGNAL